MRCEFFAITDFQQRYLLVSSATIICDANVLFTGVVRSDLSARSSSDGCLPETQQTLRILCW